MKRIRITILLLMFLIFLLKCFYQEKNFANSSRKHLENHSRILADSLWKIDEETAFQYLLLAMRTDNYLNAQIFLYPIEDPFLTMANDSDSSWENFLLKLPLDQIFTLEELVYYGDREIGLICVTVINKKRRRYPYEILLLYILGVVIIKIIEKNLKRKGEYLESETRFKTLVENIPGISYRCLPTEEWTMTFLSNEVENITGYTRDDLIKNNKLSFLSLIDPPDRSRVSRVVQNALIHRTPFMVEYTLIKRDGSRCWVYDRGQGIFDQEGHTKYIDGVILDITEQKRIKDEKNELEQKFYQAQKMESVGRLAGGIAHDFNNLLTPIMGFADLLEEEAHEKGYTTDYVGMIIETAERAKGLVNQLLTYSRKQTLTHDRIDLNFLLDSFQIILKGSINDNIELRYDLDRRIPKIWADQGKLEQVIMNMTVNAQDAMVDGGTLIIKTELSTVQKEEKEEMVSLLFLDTGIGMDEKTMEQIFDPFYSTKGDMGTGLGLATVYGIITQHGGSISVKSELNRGTEFRIDLPVRKEKNQNEV